jgi:hypothetical protein
VTVLLAQAMRLTGKNGRLLPMATQKNPIYYRLVGEQVLMTDANG